MALKKNASRETDIIRQEQFGSDRGERLKCWGSWSAVDGVHWWENSNGSWKHSDQLIMHAIRLGGWW